MTRLNIRIKFKLHLKEIHACPWETTAVVCSRFVFQSSGFLLLVVLVVVVVV
jgi:hypothetical protein